MGEYSRWDVESVSNYRRRSAPWIAAFEAGKQPEFVFAGGTHPSKNESDMQNITSRIDTKVV
jgi:hypothetical protein